MEEETQAAACKAEWDQTVDFFCTQIDTQHSKSAAYMAEVMKQGYVADDDEWYARAKADTSIGMFVLAWSALAPPHSHLYSALMPIAILFVQFSFTASLFVVEMQSINGMQSWCPNSASMNEKLIMGSIAIAYAIKLHMQREAYLYKQEPWSYYKSEKVATKAYVESNLVNPGSRLANDWGLEYLDDFIMNGAFVVIVYLLNLLIVFTTDEPMDMLLNMLALEFILQLDDEFKSIFMVVKKQDLLHAMRKLDRECMSQRCASVLTPVLPIAHKTTTFLLKLAVWACVFVVVVGPVCK